MQSIDQSQVGISQSDQGQLPALHFKKQTYGNYKCVGTERPNANWPSQNSLTMKAFRLLNWFWNWWLTLSYFLINCSITGGLIIKASSFSLHSFAASFVSVQVLGKIFRSLSMRSEKFQKSEHAQWYFQLFEQNPLFIHHVECKLCFSTVNEGNYKLNLKLLRVN